MEENKNIDRSQGMSIVCNKLKEKDIGLSNKHALEVFAREGDWQTTVYANKVKTLEAWETNPKFEEGLRRNLPMAKIRIIDSIKELQSNKDFQKYDFVVIDNPQGCFGSGEQYCEHFDVIKNIYKVLSDEAIVIFNINKEPYDFDKFSAWQRRRSEFYGVEDTSNLEIDFLLQFYKNFFSKSGYDTDFCFNVCREKYKNEDYLHYFVFSLKKIKSLKRGLR